VRVGGFGIPDVVPQAPVERLLASCTISSFGFGVHFAALSFDQPIKHLEHLLDMVKQGTSGMSARWNEWWLPVKLTDTADTTKGLHVRPNCGRDEHNPSVHRQQ
jgi:hypothetical protein